MMICLSKASNSCCCYLPIQVQGTGGALFYLNEFAKSGACVLFYGGGGS